MSDKSECDEIDQLDPNFESESKKLYFEGSMSHKSSSIDFAPQTRLSGVVGNELYQEQFHEPEPQY